jgi:PTH1 family peptidyl-tRNA hydrolase
VVVGLGNPGPEYQATRHNAGFMAADAMAARLGRFSGWTREGSSLRAEGRAGRHAVRLVKPQQYMNRSGQAVRELLSEGWIASEILVVYDEVYLPFGTLRLRGSGGAGGHQGLESIVDSIGTSEFPRLRIGVGPAPPSADLPEYVLAPFSEEERKHVGDLIEAAGECAFDAAALGLTHAMNRWNRYGRDTTEERGDDETVRDNGDF